LRHLNYPHRKTPASEYGRHLKNGSGERNHAKILRYKDASQDKLSGKTDRKGEISSGIAPKNAGYSLFGQIHFEIPQNPVYDRCSPTELGSARSIVFISSRIRFIIPLLLITPPQRQVEVPRHPVALSQEYGSRAEEAPCRGNHGRWQVDVVHLPTAPSFLDGNAPELPGWHWGPK